MIALARRTTARLLRRPAAGHACSTDAVPVFHPPGVIRLVSPSELAALATRAAETHPGDERTRGVLVAQGEAWAR